MGILTPDTSHTPWEKLPSTKPSHVVVNYTHEPAKVLSLIPDRETSEDLFQRHLSPSEIWFRPAVEHIHRSLWETFAAELGTRRSTSSLRAMADWLTQNSSSPLREEEDDVERWLRSFSGPNMRWESLAILFIFWGFGAGDVRGYDAGGGLQGRWQSGREQRRAIAKYKDCAAACISLADAAHSANCVLLYAMQRHQILSANLAGDASLLAWRLHGETVAMTTFLGLHAESPSAPYKPTVMSEARRRLFAGVFFVDKRLAIFTGRPPLLSRRHVSTPLPLDLDNSVLLAGGQELAAAVRKLDPDGWDAEGTFRSTSTIRGRALLGYVRDAIMDLALGNLEDTPVETIIDLRNRELDAVERLPPALRYREEDIMDILARHANASAGDDMPGDDVPGAALYTKFLMRLEHLLNMFFIDRLLVKKDPYHSTSLLSTSVEIVGLTLSFWTYKSRLYAMHGDLECLVMSFAAPASGILCMELKNRTVHDDPSLSRSTIIQKLSQLVGFLEFIVPGAPNGELCRSAKVAIQHVLDRELNGSQPALADQRLDIPNTILDAVALSDFQLSSFDLLDTFDWMRPYPGNV